MDDVEDGVNNKLEDDLLEGGKLTIWDLYFEKLELERKLDITHKPAYNITALYEDRRAFFKQDPDLKRLYTQHDLLFDKQKDLLFRTHYYAKLNHLLYRMLLCDYVCLAFLCLLFFCHFFRFFYLRVFVCVFECAFYFLWCFYWCLEPTAPFDENLLVDYVLLLLQGVPSELFRLDMGNKKFVLKENLDLRLFGCECKPFFWVF